MKNAFIRGAVRVLYCCLFLAVLTSASAQEQNLQLRADSIYALPEDTLALIGLFELAKETRRADAEFDRDLSWRGIGMARRLGAAPYEGRFHLRLSDRFKREGQQDSTDYHMARALEIAERVGPRSDLARVHRNYQWLYYKRGEYDKALESGFKALALFRTLNDRSSVAQVLNYQGITLWYQENLSEALKYSREAYELYEEVGPVVDFAQAAQVLAGIYLDMKDLESAERYCNKAIELYRSTDTPDDAMYPLNTLAGIYAEGGRIDEAIEIYQEILEIAERLGVIEQVRAAVYTNLGEMYSTQGKYRQALDLYKPLLSDLLTANSKKQVVSTYITIADAYAGLGQYDSAYHYQKLHTDLGDELLNEETNARVAEIETQYEVAEQERTISEQQSEIETQAREQRWTLFGLAGAALLSGLIFWFYQKQRRTSAQLEQKNRQNEFLVKEIHHRTKNNLQVLSSLLSLQTDYIDDPAALDAVNEGRNRVQTIGLLHQQLYTGHELSVIDPKEYFPNLGTHLLDTFDREDSITINYDLTTPPLDIETAIPLGLIANELLTNSLKYAYPEGTEGTIDFSLKIVGKELVLRVADHGRGIASATTSTSTSFGRDLVDILKHKLKGTVHETTEGGWATEVRCRQFSLGEGVVA